MVSYNVEFLSRRHLAPYSMQPSDMSPGAVVAQRFVIEELAGAGGMGTVFRAHDLQSGRKIALKLLYGRSVQQRDLERFGREAQLLSELHHPGIVSYVAHGQAQGGIPYLAMQWLEGEDLSVRLERGRLTPRETLILLEKAADALAAAHRVGIIHRDIKPSNLYLRDGQVERLTLLDFGLARRAAAPPMTRSGTVLGTLDYMAPEQARGHQKEIGPSADIFSLGSVVYECLTGKPPFYGEEMATVLAKILFEEAPRLHALWPEVPQSLETLVSRMLAKDPRTRPQDATALLQDLVGLGELRKSGIKELLYSPSDAAAPEAVSLADGELLLFSVIVAIPFWALHSAGSGGEASRPEEEWARHSQLRRVLSDLGATCELLADGSLVAALTETGSATDQVAQAGRCALAVQERWPDAYVALATGRGVLNQRTPVGEAIDRAVRMVRTRAAQQRPSASAIPSRHSFEGVWLDEVSAGLLDTRFSVVSTNLGAVLHGERTTFDESRPLLGKPTPCLGRELELGTLLAAFTSCMDESTARAVLVTAPPGIGKSRLRHEFLRRLRSRELDCEILLARGEPMSAGSPNALLCQALRRLCGLHSGEPPAEQRAKLKSCLTRYVEPHQVRPITEFLGELCALPFPEDASVKLRAARNDPKIMRDQIAQAFLMWLRAECMQHPVLLILEDLHWGDPLTVRLVDLALRELGDQPFMVLGLARPEVTQLFPNLWVERRVQNIRLGPLTRKVCERFVFQILGRTHSRDTIQRIIEQSEGNALYLEELVRAVAEGKGDALPETVLAMLQARISRLEPGARRVLRGASLFGKTFWRDGVRTLYGGGRATEDLDHSLEVLLADEIIAQHQESRFPGEIEYSFRHLLMRDAAYSLLTETDRSLGHRLAAMYLERRGETDAMVLAEHLRLSDDCERAIPYYIRAAEQSYAGNDSEGVLVRTAKAEECGVKGEQLGRLRTLQFLAYFWRAEWASAFPRGLEALTLLPAGSLWWCTAMSHLFVIAANINETGQLQEQLSLFTSVQPALDAHCQYITAASVLVTMFSLLGSRQQACRFLDSLQRAARGHGELDDTTRGFLNQGHAWYTRILMPDPFLACTLAQQCVEAFQRTEDVRNLLNCQVLLGMAQKELGDLAASEATLTSSLELAERQGEPFMVATAKLYLASLLSDQTADAPLLQAQQLARAMLELNLGPNYTGFAHGVLSQILRHQGDLQAAEEHARKAVAMLVMMRPYQIVAFINLCRALLAQGRVGEARAAAEQGLQIVTDLGGSGYNEVSLRLAVAEARYADSDLAAAHEALAFTLAELQRRAVQIVDPEQRARFLQQVPDNARARELARLWLGQKLS